MNKQEIKDKISEMENELVKLKEELNGHIEVGCYHDTIISFNIYFSSPEQTQKAINVIGEERLKKYYFCVEE